MQGLDLKGIKKHPSLIPLYVALGFGCFTAVFCTIRAALKNPDVSWCHKNNPEPWNEYIDKNYSKFYDPRKNRAFQEQSRSIWDVMKS